MEEEVKDTSCLEYQHTDKEHENTGDIKELRTKRRDELWHTGNEERWKDALTFGLCDRGRRGDGAEGGAAWVRRVGPGHSHRVAHPRCRVDGSDRFVYKGRREIRKLEPERQKICGRPVRTTRQREVALGRRIPALGHGEDDGPGNVRNTIN